MKNSNVVLGVLSGVAIGAIAGILFAPAKGTKTRKRIMKKGTNYTNDLKNKLGDLYNDVTSKYENVKEDANEIVSEYQGK